MTLEVAPDVLAALRGLVLSYEDFTDVADQRAFGAELPGAEAESMPRACVVFSASGGAGLGADDYSALGVQRVDVRSYGASMAEALQVHRIVQAILKGVADAVVGEALIHNCYIESRGITQRDADGRWPMVVGVYGVRMSERVIS